MREFEVGDTVRIRQWDDMVAEFGVINGGAAIFTRPYFFTRDMEPYCGLEFEITSIDPDREVCGHGLLLYSICTDMLELAYTDEDSRYEEAENHELDEFLKIYKEE